LEAGRYPENLKALDTWGFGLRQFASKQTYAFLENEGYYHRYSYDSYYVREAKNQNEMNLSALSELVRYFDQIIDRDVRYLCSPHGRKNWYSDLAKRPIRTKDRIKGKTGVVLENIGIV
jgi:hypothetical protein